MNRCPRRASPRQWLSQELHFDLVRSLRAGRAALVGWRVTLEVEVHFGPGLVKLTRIPFVPEPVQAAA